MSLPHLARLPGSFSSDLLALALRLAALTHDVGKMSDAFQAKLRRACGGETGPKGEFIRHDAMSYRVLRGLGWRYAALGTLPSLSPAALAGAVAARSAADLRDTFSADLKDDLTRLRRVLAPGGGRRGAALVPMSVEEMVCRLGAFLSLTHHRLPGPGRHAARADLTYELSLTAETYFNPGEAAEYDACLRFSGGNVFQMDAALGAALAEVLADLQVLTAGTPSDFDQNSFVRLALAHGRPVLVLSDHLASGLKSGEYVAPSALLGNTVRPANEALPARPGDTLATHVLSVYRHTQHQAQFALDLSSNQLGPLPTLARAAQHAIDAKRCAAGKFGWQAELHDHLKAGAGAPAFVAVTAGTGSGKTIASAQVMRALGSSRWTYCLGLRSLTLQTGRSYQEDLNLTDADLAVVIGDQVAKKAFEMESQAGNEAAGSESLIQEPEATLVAGAQPEEWLALLTGERTPAELKSVFPSRKLDFVAAPVVVCTVDQLIGVTRLSSVSKALEYKRLQSADLVLDEIDNYSPDELKHIARLCCLVGLARKNLVCLSATMGPLHVEALLDAYREGVRLNHQLTGLGADLRFTTAANTCPPASVLLGAGVPLQAALEHNERFNLATRDAGDRLPPKATLGLLECQAGAHAHVLEEALRLHAINATDVDGARVSAGFIKMNTVGSARSLAKYLFEVTDLPADVELAVVCYHARYTGLEMTLIDRALNQVTNRKRLSPGSEFSAEALQHYIRPILAGVRKPNLLIIAVTTSIIETGRDHDYDWAILEPSSHRSLIQAAGRVRRHRDAGAAPAQNVSLIAYPARACGENGYAPRNPVSVFSFPGPLTALAERKFSEADLPYPQLLELARTDLGIKHPLAADIARDASAHGFLPAYSAGIRNAVALTPPRDLTNSLAALEQYVLFKSLTEPAAVDVLSRRQESVSARAQQEKGMWLSTWAYQDSFRDDSANFIEDQVYLMQPHTLAAGRYAVTGPTTRAGGVPANVSADQVDLAHPFRSLLTGAAGGASGLNTLLAAEAADLFDSGFTKSDLFEFSCYSPERRGSVPATVHYAPLIGFDRVAVV